MGKAVLVEQEINDARQLLLALDKQRLVIDTMAWAFYSEIDAWSLNVASPLADATGLEGVILAIIRTVDQLKLASISFLDLNVFRDADDFTQVVRESSEQYPIAESWLSGYVVGGSELDKLYVYRCFSQVVQYRGFYVGTELAPRRDTTYRVYIKTYPPAHPRRRGTPLMPVADWPAFDRTLGITDEAAAVAPRQLLSAAGPQSRVWAFLSERGLSYARRIIDLVLDRHVSSVIPSRELLLTSDMADFPFTAQDDAALLEAEFAAPSRV